MIKSAHSKEDILYYVRTYEAKDISDGRNKNDQTVNAAQNYNSDYCMTYPVKFFAGEKQLLNRGSNLWEKVNIMSHHSSNTTFITH